MNVTSNVSAEASDSLMSRQGLIWLAGTLLGAGALMAAFTLGFRNSALGFGVCAFISIVVLALRDISEGSHRHKVRQKAMRATADRLGLSFRETAPVNVLGWSASFQLTCDGMQKQQAAQQMLSAWTASVLRKESKNIIEQSSQDITLAIFDYDCDKPGYDDVTTRQTVFAVRSARLEFPHFALVPASSWDRFATKFRGNVAIREGHRLSTPSEGLMARFDEQLFDLLDEKTCLEAGEGFLLLYQREHVIAADDLKERIKTGLEIYANLCNQTLKSDPTVVS